MGAAAVEELVAQGRVVARAQARLLELAVQVADAAADPRFGATSSGSAANRIYRLGPEPP